MKSGTVILTISGFSSKNLKLKVS